MTLPGGPDLQECVILPPPDDFTVSVRVIDRYQREVPASYLITVRSAGPVLIHYGVEGVRGQWVHRCGISDEAVVHVWRCVSMCRLLRDGAVELTGGEQRGEWLAVRGWGRSAWVPLDETGTVRDWPVVAELERLVVPEVWRHIKRRRRLLLEGLRESGALSVGAAR